MSGGINLRPWREEKRRIRDRWILTSGVSIWILCVVMIILSVFNLRLQQVNQQTRNNYLFSEIRKLENKIKQIESLKEKKRRLVARMKVIQDLQRERAQIVHLFDDIVRKLPEEVQLTSLAKKNKQISLKGTAQSNARVSELMNRLDSSAWFTNSDLNVINVAPDDKSRLSQFQINVLESAESENESEGL